MHGLELTNIPVQQSEPPILQIGGQATESGAGMGMETRDDDSLKYQIAIRCAKAAVLVSSLKTSQNCSLRATIDHGNEEREILRRAITDLKIELAKERRNVRRIKFCGLVGLVLILLSLCGFCLILAIKY